MNLLEYYREMNVMCLRNAALAGSHSERVEWTNIAEGFRKKSLKLTIGEAKDSPTSFQMSTYLRQKERLREILSARGLAS